MTPMTRKAFQILGCSAIFLLVWGILFYSEVLFLEMHSDYTRFNPVNTYATLSIVLGLMAFIYLWIYNSKKRISNLLTVAHLLGTYAGLLGLWGTIAFFEGGRRVYEQPMLLNASEGHQNWWLFLVMMFAMAQFAFLTNLMIAAASKRSE